MKDRHDTVGFGRLLAMSNVAYSLTAEATANSRISPYPVAIERAFRPFEVLQSFRRIDETMMLRRPPTPVVVRRLYFSPGDLDLARASRAVSGMAGIDGLVGFECYVRAGRARFFLVAADHEIDVAAGNFRAAYPELAVVLDDDPRRTMQPVRIVYELYSSEPYHRAVQSAHGGLWAPLFHIFASADDGESSFEVRYSRARHPWQRNMAGLLVAERSLGHRAPHGQSVTLKRLDAPLFVAIIRIATTSTRIAGAIESFIRTFTVDGVPLCYRSIDDFTAVLGFEGVQRMVRDRSAHTPGELLTADELALFVQPPDTVAAGLLQLDLLQGLPVPSRLTGPGIPLGLNTARGVVIEVRQPLGQHNKSSWLIGRSRSGKTISLLHRCRFLAQQGHGVLLLDPHRTMAFDILGVLDGVDLERIIFLDFDAPLPVAYNPFSHDHPAEFGRLTSEYQHSLKHLFGTDSMHRTTHFLGNAIYACLVLPNANLATIPSLFSKTPAGEQLRRRVITVAVNSEVRRFWQDEFPTHRSDAFAPIVNRLSAMLLDDQTLLTFSQSENRVDIAQWMDESKVVIIAPPRSNEPAGILCGCIIAQAKQAALRRAGTPQAQRHCHLIIDEWHRFITSAATVESIIHETSKGGLSVVLANQDTGQLPNDLLKAAFSIPNIFVHSVNLPDARTLAHLFNGTVTPETLASQSTGSVYARIDQDIVNYQATPPLQLDHALAARVIERSTKYHAAVTAPAAIARSRRHIEPLE